MCDRVGVVYAGMLVEEGATEGRLQRSAPSLYGGAAALPAARRPAQGQGRLDTIPGFLPGIGADIKGCAFADRCALADDRCRSELPPLLRSERARRCRAASITRRRKRCRAPHRAMSRQRPRRATVPVLRVAGRKKTSPAVGHPCAPSKDVSLDPARRNAGAGRRVRQRQDDLRARLCSAWCRPMTAALSNSRAKRWRRQRETAATTRSRRCRSSSRIRIPRSTARIRSGTSSAAP